MSGPVARGLAAAHAVPAALLAGFAFGGAAQAQSPVGEVGQCLARAEAAFRAAGARAVDVAPPEFMATEAQRVVALRGDAGRGCVGLVALGPTADVDVDATLFTASGIQLMRDDSTRGFAYVEHCGGDASLELRAVVSVVAGQGEIRWLRFAGASPKTDLNRSVGDCFAGGAGVRVAPPDLGPEPRAEGSASTGGPSQLDRLRSRGFESRRPPETLRLRAREERTVEYDLTAGTCYAFSATGGTGVEDIDLVLQDPVGREVSKDDAPARDALIEACATATGRFALIVTLYAGAGEVTVAALEASRVAGDEPAGLEGPARIDFRMARAVLAERGFETERMVWAHLRSGEQIPIPVAVRGGRCYAFTALLAESVRPPRQHRMDLGLLDADGVLLGEDVRFGEPPVIYRCPEVDGRVKLLARMFGAEGRVIVMVGESAEEGGAR